MEKKENKELKIKTIWRAVRMFFFLFLMLRFLAPVCFSQVLDGVPSSVQNPQDLQKWLSSTFEYQMKIPDVPQSVEETLHSKAGDCDDLANLASRALAELGIPSEVVVITTKGVDIKHAICVWKDEGGHYNFFTNQQLIYTKKKSMGAAIRYHFPLYESVSVLNPPPMIVIGRVSG